MMTGPPLAGSATARPGAGCVVVADGCEEGAGGAPPPTGPPAAGASVEAARLQPTVPASTTAHNAKLARVIEAPADHPNRDPILPREYRVKKFADAKPVPRLRANPCRPTAVLVAFAVSLNED